MDPVPAYTRLTDVYDDVVVDDVHPEWADWMLARWAADERPVHRVLDVGCGTGTLAAVLIRHGCEVVGLDPSASMLARARRRLGADAVLVEGGAADPPQEIRDLAPFDAVVSTFDVLNNLTSDEVASALRAFAQLTRPGGWFVADVHTPAMLALVAADPRTTGGADGWTYVLEHEVDAAEGTVLSRITLRQESGDAFTEEHLQHVHSPEVLERLLRDAGYVDLGVADEYSDAPVDEGTLRATWTARRP